MVFYEGLGELRVNVYWICLNYFVFILFLNKNERIIETC